MALQLSRQVGVVKQGELIIEHNKCKQQLQRLDGSEQRISQVIEAHETM
jgi:hypothetical protein